MIFAEDEFYIYKIEIKKIKKRNQKDPDESHSHYVSRKATEKYQVDDQFKARAKMRYYKNLYKDNSFFQNIMNKDIKDSEKFEEIKNFHNSQKIKKPDKSLNITEKLNQIIPTYIN